MQVGESATASRRVRGRQDRKSNHDRTCQLLTVGNYVGKCTEFQVAHATSVLVGGKMNDKTVERSCCANFDHDNNIVRDGHFCCTRTVNLFETEMVLKQGSVIGDGEGVPEMWF